MLNDLTTSYAKVVTERTDLALRGAWMGDYRYLHVFETPRMHPLGRSDIEDMTLSLPQYRPSNEASHPTEHNGHKYSYTYDLHEVPDEVLVDALNGNLEVDYEQ